MSETKEGFFYDLYDFTKSVYIFSHMKTNLVDTAVQIGEKVALSLILAITSGLAIFVLFGYYTIRIWIPVHTFSWIPLHIFMFYYF